MRTYSLLAGSGLGLIMMLTACSSSPQAAPAPVPSSSATTTPTSPAPTPGPETSTPTPTATADDAVDGADAFSAALLTDLCIGKTRDYYADVQFFPEDARVERRKVDPPWLVIVPSRSAGPQSASVCTIGGSPSAPVFGADAAQTPPTDQEIQDLIDGVEHYGGE